jgi:hypothetical protein
VYEYLEAEGFQYAIRLPANQVLQAQLAPLLTRPVGRPPHYVRRFYASFRYQAQSWSRSRRVVAKVEWHPGELYPRVGFLVTNLRRSAWRVVTFYNGRGTAEQWIKEGKHVIRWTRLSCTTFPANAVRLQLHALAYNLANFLRTLALRGEIERWSLTTLREKVVKLGAKVIAHGRSWSSRWRRWRCRASCSAASWSGSQGYVRQTQPHADALLSVQRKAAGVELRPECVLEVPQSGRTALGDVRTPVAVVTTAGNPCLRGREGGIQAQGRGWAPSIWEMSA